MLANSDTRLSVRPWAVAYVMTYYPAVSLTFLAGEIDEIEKEGGSVFPIAINTSSPSDLTTNIARRRRDRTLYLKQSVWAVIAATLGCLCRHPVALPRLAFHAICSARTDAGLMLRRLAHLSYAALVAKRCTEQGVSHIHAQFGQAPATIAWFATEIMRFRTPTPVSWSFTIHGFQDFVDEAVARLDLKAPAARFVVCVSQFTKSQLCRITDPDLWDRFHVIHCGIDLDLFKFRSPPQPSVTPLAVIVGRLSPEKGHLVLFQAVKALKERNVPMALDVVGGGPFEQRLRNEVDRLDLQASVNFVGELTPDQVKDRLNGADIFCMASFSEGLPISIMEAMAMGVPVVSTWIAGIPELAVNEITALTVAPGDANALADAIERVIHDPALCARMISAARAAIEQRHSLPTNARSIAELFQISLIANRSLDDSNADGATDSRDRV